MKIMAHMLLAGLLVVIASPSAAETGQHSVDVTYIANAGYMITSRSEKILVDAVFDDGLGHYERPARAIRKKLRKATVPFDDVSLILVSHWHDDHFDADMVADHLENNAGAVLVAPRQVVDRLARRDSVADIEAQINVATPELGESIYSNINGIDLRVLGMAHAPYYANGVDKHADVENIGFIVTVGGVTLFHSGDAILDVTPEFADAARLDEADIDIVFLKSFDRSDNSIDVVKNVIHPREIVIMHIPLSDKESVTEIFRDIYPQVTVMDHPMASLTFSVGE